jgi:error-prone DNA polymerase
MVRGRNLRLVNKTMGSEQYIEFHARSAFSFLRGAATPEELIAVCSELQMPAMALLDNDGVYGAGAVSPGAQKAGINGTIRR